MTQETPEQAMMTETELKHVKGVASAFLDLQRKSEDEPTLANRTCVTTFLNFMQAYLPIAAGEVQGVTPEAFAENLISYEAYWDSPAAIQFSGGQEAEGALKAIRLMMDILEVKKAA